MLEAIRVEYGGAPDGLHTMIGFQPPLNEEQKEVVESAMENYLEIPIHGTFLSVTKLIERVPDEGEPYSECQARPTQLHDGRAEAVGDRLVPVLVKAAVVALIDHHDAAISVTMHKSETSKGKTLFNGKMRVWYEEGRDPKPEPYPPIISKVA